MLKTCQFCGKVYKTPRELELENILSEIKKVCIEDTREFADGTTVHYDALDEILDIINKAKGDNDENT